MTAAASLHLDTLVQATEKEPNDTPGGATTIKLPVSVWGRQDKAGDLDHFSFDAKKGQSVVLDLAARRIGAKTEAVLTLLNGSGQSTRWSRVKVRWEMSGEIDDAEWRSQP